MTDNPEAHSSIEADGEAQSCNVPTGNLRRLHLIQLIEAAFVDVRRGIAFV